MEVIDDLEKNRLVSFSDGAENLIGVSLRDNGKKTTLSKNFSAKESK